MHPDNINNTAQTGHQTNGNNATDRRKTHADYGVRIDSVIDDPEPAEAHPELRWNRIRHIFREPWAEFLGTFMLVLFGDGAIAMSVLSAGAKGNWLTICLGFGIGLMIGVYTSGPSGGHVNPAVTLANCVYRKFPWKKLPIYVAAQVLGAMCAAAVVYGNYKSAINVFEGGADIRTVPGVGNDSNATAGIFATYPAPFVTRTGQFFSEFLGTTLLMFTIYALKDDGNVGSGPLTPLVLLFVLGGIAISFGWETGFALNPARDFGPRLITCFLGYGGGVWSSSGYYFWVPIVAPCLGALFGGFLYDTMLFTGQSPINTPMWGLKCSRRSSAQHHRRRSDHDDRADLV
jgi:aquaglyceroporin related protein